MRKKLGVNIDHIATLREARKINYPDPIYAAAIAEQAGADSITIHLREDRRHIQERDLYVLKDTIKTSLNLEMALSTDIIEIALNVMPEDICIVPERRQEVTTEGGFDVITNLPILKQYIPGFHSKNIAVSLFIAPDNDQIKAAKESGAEFIEIHTGQYADAKTQNERREELEKIKRAVKYARGLGLRVNAGHGLNYQNTYHIARIDGIEILNIGHSIISRAVFTGLEQAVRDMVAILDRANWDKEGN
jgi:pyridoxine 5-phosphate synthase